MLRRSRTLPLSTSALLATIALAGCGGDGTNGTSGGSTTSSSSGSGGSGVTVDEVMANLPQSCAFSCGPCPEPDTVYPCPTLGPWADVPHADSCPSWDGSYPAPVQGQCTATIPSGEAVAPA